MGKDDVDAYLWRLREGQWVKGVYEFVCIIDGLGYSKFYVETASIMAI